MKHPPRLLSIVALLMIIFIDAMGWGIALPVFQPIFVANTTGLLGHMDSVGTRSFYYETMIAVYCIFMFLFSPVLGSLSDKYGRKKVLLLSMCGAASGFFFCYLGILISSLALVFLGRIVSGITAGSFPIAQAAMIDVSEPHQVATRISWIGIANGVGFACGPIIGGFFLDPTIFHPIHYDLPFLLCVGLTLIGVMLTSLFFKETFVGNPEVKLNLLTGVIHIYQAFSEKKTWRIFLSLFLFMMGFATFFTMMPLLLSLKFSQDGSQIGYFMTYYAVIFSIGLIVLLPRLTSRFSLKNIVLTSLAFQVGLYVVFVMTPSMRWLWVWMAPIAVLIPFSYVGIVTLISNMTDPSEQGRYMGVVGSVIALTFGIGPILSGVGNHLSLAFPYMVSVGLIFAALILVHCSVWQPAK